MGVALSVIPDDGWAAVVAGWGFQVGQVIGETDRQGGRATGQPYTPSNILATLYQVGFARSKPHGAPRSNEFGIRVAQVYEQPWLRQMMR